MTTYINAASFEERCLALPTRVPEAASTRDQFLTLDFSGYEDVAPYVFNRSAMLRLLKEKNYDIKLIRAPVISPLHATRELETLLGDRRDSEIVLDISSLPRTFIFTFSRLLAALQAPVKVLYVRPETYGSELSRGVRLLSTVPGFEGEVDPEGASALVIILGFEGYKADHAVEVIGPSTIVAMIGDPPFEEEFVEHSRRLNQSLLNRQDVQERALHTLDPFVAVEQLEEVYNDVSGRDVSVVLCPLGTKPQSLASFVFAEGHPDVAVLCISSVRYLPHEYSRGFCRDIQEFDLAALLSHNGAQAPG